MESFANLSRRVQHHILRHEIRESLTKISSVFKAEKLPHLHDFLGFPDDSLVDYLVRTQGLAAKPMTDSEKVRFSREILKSLDGCSQDNPIHSAPNARSLIRAVILLDEFEKEHQHYLHSFFGYQDCEKGLSLEDLEQQLEDYHFAFCHRVSDRLDRAFWSLPADLLVSFEKIPTSKGLIAGWKVTAWLIQRQQVISQVEGMLTTAYFDGLSKNDFLEAFSELGDYMNTLGQAIAHEIGRSALPFDCFDALYGDVEDDVTGCLHVLEVETAYEFRELGYARALTFGVGEVIRNLNEMDVITQKENGWSFTDPATYNGVIHTCHKSLIHNIAANYVSMTTLSDPVSVMIERHIREKRACHGGILADVVKEGVTIKDQILSSCRKANRKAASPLGNCWIHYPQWEYEIDYSTPAGELA